MKISVLKNVVGLLLILSGIQYSVYAQYPESELGWKLGSQAYTFNHFTFFEAVDKIQQADLKYVEAFPGQELGGGFEGTMDFRMSPAKRQQILKKLKEKGVELYSFGVVGAEDGQGWEEIFRFAKAMGIKNIVAEPRPEQLDLISDLCDNYKINLALHNHPKPSRYWHPDIVLEALIGRSERIGTCADIGHWVRSGIDPVECLKKLKGHIFELHFKDLNKKAPDAHDVPWGTGISDIKAVMDQLYKQDFKGAFFAEYEYKWENNLPEIIKSVAFFREQAKALSE